MRSFMFSLRYLLKARGNNITRMVTLVLGMSMGVMMFSYINYQRTFDRNLPDHKRIYKLYVTASSEGKDGVYGGHVAPIAPTLQDECPQVEAATRIYGQMKYDYTYGDKQFVMDFYAVDSMFFAVLDYGVVSGNLDEFYSGSNTMMLSESMAQIVFGDDDPLGKVMKDQYGNDLYVTGVFKDPPFNNHLGEFNMLMSFRRVEHQFNLDWGGENYFSTYIKLHKSANIAEVEKRLDEILNEHDEAYAQKLYNQSYFFKPVMKSNMMAGTRRQYLILMSYISFLVVFVTAMNYVLVSISGLVNRSKTIAMLRCNGARKRDVFNIFLCETAIILFVSSVLTAVEYALCRNGIESMCSTPLSEIFNPSNLWVTCAVTLIVFLVSSLIPASVFCSVPLTAAFRGTADNRRGWKKVLLCFQIVCITFSIAMIILSSLQFDLLRNGDQGYEHDRLLSLSLMGNYEMFIDYEDRLRSMPEVEQVGTNFNYPIYGFTDQNVYDETTREFLFSAGSDRITPSYFDAMGMKIVLGHGLTEQSSVYDVVVNEQYVKMRGWKDSPLGHEIIDGNAADAQRYKIVGVVNDFRIGANDGAFQALVYYNIKSGMPETDRMYGGYRTMVKVREMSPESIAAVEQKIKDWHSTDNNHVRVYDSILYMNLRGEESFRGLTVIVGIVTLIIALIGLVGYLNEELLRRRKEIAVRKVNGATMSDVMGLFSGSLMKLALPAMVVGNIAAYLLGSLWMQQFSNRTPMYWWVFAGAMVAVSLITLVTIQILARHTAGENPIIAIKS